jgi:hypothetical protein
MNYNRAAICLIRLRDRLPSRVIHLEQVEWVAQTDFKKCDNPPALRESVYRRMRGGNETCIKELTYGNRNRPA